MILQKNEPRGGGALRPILLATILGLGGFATACGGSEAAGSGGGGSGGGGSGGGGTTTGTGAADACSPGPQEKPSTQLLSIELESTAAADRYVITTCEDCETLRVESKGDLDYVTQSLVLTSAQTCGCQCTTPSPYPLAFHRLVPGAKYTVTWDTRTLATCSYQQDCGGGKMATTTVGALQPAGAGDYRVSVGVIVNLPVECKQVGSSDEFSCTKPAQAGLDPGGGFYPVEVTLPESGNVSAKLSVP